MAMMRWSAVAAMIALAGVAGCARQQPAEQPTPGAEQPATEQAASAAEQPASAAASPHGPWIGTWKRNPEKSSSPFNGTSIFKMWVEGDGFRYTLDMTPASGEPIHMTAFGRFDGKLYPEKGNPSADFNRFTRVDDHTYALVDIKDGKENIRFRITISPDGQTRTSVATRKNAQGEEVTSTGVWDRIE